MMGGMRTAPDGSPVEVYPRLPERTPEAALIHRLLPAGGTVLDLGCGTGRLAEPLARLGHPVTGVDNEPEMLGALDLTTAVHADIIGLDLRRRFDAVLLMSHFVAAADEEFVIDALGTVRRHLAPSGFAVVERHQPGWAETCTESTKDIRGVRCTLYDLARSSAVRSSASPCATSTTSGWPRWRRPPTFPPGRSWARRRRWSCVAPRT